MIDERYIMHRYKSTRIAAAVGSAIAAGFFAYAYLTRGVVRWDLFIVVVVMAVVKVIAMLYFRRTN